MEWSETTWKRRSGTVGSQNRAIRKHQYSLGRAYENGNGVAQDHSEAAEWYRKAAGQDETDALYLLADLYRRGDGVAQDDAKAEYWYRKAAHWNHEAAQKTLSSLEGNADSAGRV